MNTRSFTLGTAVGFVPALIVVAILGCATPPAQPASPSPAPTSDRSALAYTDPWMQPCTDAIADAGGSCKGEPVPWPYTTGETLVCGQDAKPAIDHREDGIGWWAYCEPALIGGE